ncbi:MAG: restriction endonuclease subunit S [Bacilli bacterium]|nr:restriction endonuclease subunit S [Bacilli bacterium]
MPYYKLGDLLIPYSLKNGENNYEPVSIGKYGIRKRNEIYKKELASDYSKNKVIFKNTLVIGLGTSQIDVGVLTEDAFYSVSPAYFTFKIDANKVNPEYLKLYFEVYNDVLSEKYLIASARQGKKVDIVSLFEETINVPSSNEQKAAVLEMENIRSLQEKNESLLTLIDEYLESQFVRLFGDPVFNSMDLPTKPLSKLGLLKRGTSRHRPRNDLSLLGGPYPLIQTGDVAQADIYITEYHSTYSELGLSQSKMWPKGTLCITIAANIAQTAILNFDACFPDSVVGFKTNGEITNLYLLYWFHFLQPILEENAPEAARKNLNVDILENLEVIVPSMKKQIEFEGIINDVVALKNKIKTRKKYISELLIRRMNDYFEDDDNAKK